MITSNPKIMSLRKLVLGFLKLNNFRVWDKVYAIHIRLASEKILRFKYLVIFNFLH